MTGGNPIPRKLPELARHAGRWIGTYRDVDPQGALVDQYDFTIDVAFPASGPEHYVQHSAYRWPDGRTRQLRFAAAYDAATQKVVWDDGRISGALWQIADHALYMWFRFADQPGVEVTELIELSPCGQHRARTWHWRRENILFRRTLVSERRG